MMLRRPPSADAGDDPDFHESVSSRLSQGAEDVLKLDKTTAVLRMSTSEDLGPECMRTGSSTFMKF